MAPECESAPGSPHDSICMTVATRFGSSPNRVDHAMILSCQWCTAGSKRGAREAACGAASLAGREAAKGCGEKTSAEAEAEATSQPPNARARAARSGADGKTARRERG